MESIRFAALACLAGCSLALSGPSSNRPKHTAPDCDRSKSLVGVDGVIGGLLGVTGLAMAADNEGGGAAVPLVFGALYILSAVHGNSVVDECRAADVAYAAEEHRLPRIGEDDEPKLPGRASRASLKRQIDAQAAPDATPPTAPAAPAVQDAEAPPTPAAPLPKRAIPPPRSTPPPTPPPPPAPPPPAKQDPWSDFWREVP